MTPARVFHFILDELARFVVPPQVLAEWIVALFLVLCIAYAPFGKAAWLVRLCSGFVRFSHARIRCILLCGIVPVLLRLALLGVNPVPEPSIHDEFSHLLLGDTLAHWRLANPPHPLWRHFETIHVIQQPTYSSMYPPAQGAVLAFGQVIFHQPWAGVLLAVGAMFAAMCWMMQGWLPAPWALYGTLIAILKIGVTGLWVDSYLPAAVPSLGGALLIGALPRLQKGGARPLHSFLFGAGAVILMQSRPFEGAVLVFAAVTYFVLEWLRTRGQGEAWNLRRLRIVILPAGALLAAGFAFTGFYSWRVTGNPLLMPYQVNRDTYGWPENLGFLPPKKLALKDQTLQAMYLKEVNHRTIYQSVDKFLDDIAVRIYDNWTVLVGPLLTLPLVFLPWLAADPLTRPLVLFLAFAGFLNLFQMVLYPYHLAAVIPVLYTVIAASLRRMYDALSALTPSRGLYLAALLPLCLSLIGIMKQQAEVLDLPLAYWERTAEPHRDARAAITNWLAKRPGKQLVIVRYASWHPVNQEWVYNRADIDRSKIVWAREMDEKEDRKLIAYYADREVWLLEADELPQRVVPYKRNGAISSRALACFGSASSACSPWWSGCCDAICSLSHGWILVS
jgi:hypothetical protein